MSKTAHNPSWQPVPQMQTGMSLIELMIGMTVGLIVILAVTSTVALVNNQRRITVAGGDARESAQTALGFIDRSVRQAGAGLFHNGSLICTSINSNGLQATSLPVAISDGGNTGSDTLTVAYGTALGGNVQSILVSALTSLSDAISVNEAEPLAANRRLKVGDVFLIGDVTPGSVCTLRKVDAVLGDNALATICGGVTTTCDNITHSSVAVAPSNEQPFAATAAPGSYPAGAVVSRMGNIADPTNFVRESFGVMCDTLVTWNHTQGGRACQESPRTFTNVTPLVDGVVQVKAQYGYTASANSDIVTNWTDATGAWQNPTAGNIPNIKAIRIAVIARSKEPAVEDVTQACTNSAGVANTGPCTFDDAEAPVVNLSAVPMPSGKTWQKFRYKVYLTVIPLRNVVWSY